MNSLLLIINNNILWLQLGLILCIIVLCLVIWRRNIIFNRIIQRYEQVFNSYEPGNLESILFQVVNKEGKNEEEIHRLQDRINSIEIRIPDLVSRISMVRYKAFPDVGGDLSFSMAVLDDKGNGFILTGIHGREETRVYAKQVEKYVSPHALSNEEKNALKQAQEKR
ncbi:MAG: DUF4446 family protein [Chitinophagales bacterium]